MKNSSPLIQFTISFICIVQVSCIREGCTDPKASNFSRKANTDDGSCYYFPEPSDSVNCQNGNWKYGRCICEYGYRGPNCTDQLRPDSIRINQVNILDYPFVDENGNGWENEAGCLGTYPDLAFRFYFKDSLYFNSGYRENKDFELPFKMPLLYYNLKTAQVYKVHKLLLLDIDSDYYPTGPFCPPDDTIGYVRGVLHSPSSGFPEKVILSNDTLGLEVEFFLEYIYI